jgi:uncharacterized protein (DUF849 family)
MSKVIISCAITGAIATPSMSDALPITPEQIATSSIEAAEAGAAIIHLHARNPETGEPTPDPAMFMRVLPVIKQSTDAVLNITTGGGLKMTVEERLAAPMAAKPEMCSLNMGSMNFNISGAAEKRTEWKHDWEKEYLSRTVDHIFLRRRGADRRDHGQGPRHPLRVRVLRCRSSLQPGALPR